MKIDALEAGALKYLTKEHVGLPLSDYYEVLGWMKQMFGHALDVPMWTPERAMEEVVPNTSAGAPYDILYGQQKKQSIERLTFMDFLNHFIHFDQLSLTTLKVELRLIAKLARLFAPTNVCLIVVANWLFGAQNESLIKLHQELPSKVGLSAPGSDAYLLWQEIRSWEGYSTDADGSWWDALINLALVCIVRDLRKMFIPEQFHPLVDRYYNQVYMGNVSVLGNLVTLGGQLSGHTNTTSDNTLVHSALMCLHAWRCQMTFPEFVEKVRWYVVGDDLIYNTSTPEFHVLNLEKTWHSLGMFIESRGETPSNELTFVGMTPCKREIRGRQHWLYVYRIEKLFASMNHTEKSMTVSQRVMALVSLTINMFADKENYEFAKDAVLAFAREHYKELSMEAKHMLGKLDDITLLQLYTGYE